MTAPPRQPADHLDEPQHHDPARLDDSVVAEQIPWDQLTITPVPDRSRLWYTLAAVAVLVAVGSVVLRYVQRPAVSPLPAVTVTVSTPPVTSSATVPLAIGEPPGPEPFSEADLLAIDPAAVDRLAAAIAEWIVLEYFTLDAGDDWPDRVGVAAGVVWPTGAVPRAPGEAAVSYVEWVRTSQVSATSTGRYEVIVMMRRLVAEDGVSYRRLPAERVTIRLRATDDGGLVLEYLPALDAVSSVPASVELDVGSSTRDGPGGFEWPGGE